MADTGDSTEPSGSATPSDDEERLDPGNATDDAGRVPDSEAGVGSNEDSVAISGPIADEADGTGTERLDERAEWENRREAAAQDDTAAPTDETTGGDASPERFWEAEPDVQLRAVEGDETVVGRVDDSREHSDPLDRKIDSWKEQLLDLTRRNSLIDFTETKTKSLPVAGVTPPGIAESLHDGELRIRKQPEDEPNHGDLSQGEVRSTRPPAATSESLYRIALNEKQYLRERGVDTLYLALGTLEWYAPDEPDESYVSPLFLAAVDLEQQPVGSSQQHNYVIQPDGDNLLLNPALRKKLSMEFRLELPPDEAFGLECIDAAFQAVFENIEGFENWALSPDAVLGIFDFAKYSIYADLEQNRDAIREDPVVRALNDDPAALQEAQPASDTVNAEELDDVIDPADVYQVLDADSSQQAAIEAAKRGRSIVMQGPPGTGKSQTIANIIAEKLAANETVLFVSEKQAALNVVKDRLDDIGIGRFCLEAHGRKATKSSVLESLETELQANPVKAAPDRDGKLAELEARRDTLNAYGDALLEAPEGFTVTPYEAFGTVARHRLAPDIDIGIDDVLAGDQRELDAARDALDRLAYFDTELAAYETHPWRETRVTQWRVDTATRVEDILSSHAESIDRLAETTTEVDAALGVHASSPAEVADLRSLLEHLEERPDVDWHDHHFAADFLALDGRLEAFRDHVTRLADLRNTLLEGYRESFLNANGQELHATASQYGLFRWLRPGYYAIKNQLESHTRDGYSPSFGELKADARQLMELQQLQDELSEYDDVKSALGPFYSGRETEWERLLQAHDWVTTLRAAPFDTAPIEARLISGDLPEIPPLRADVEAAAAAFRETDEDFREIMAVAEVTVDDTPLYDAKHRTVREHLEMLGDRVDELEAWVEFSAHLTDIEDTIAAEYIDRFLDGEYDPDHLRPAFEKRYFIQLLNEMYDETLLGEFNADTFGKYLADFRRLDQEQQELAKIAVQHLVTGRRPQLNLEHADSSEQVILRREIQKQRQHKPLRELFDEAGAFVTKLKPCFMMSPLSVAQYLKKDSISFDTVIFDEASQVMPEDAISSMIRGDQVIIAGDTKQLPPTTFFDTEIDPGQGVRPDLDSILEEAAAVLPEVRLAWHYRSRSAALIEFSNQLYYNGRLQTFPENDPDTETGVEFVYVEDGVYDRGETRRNEQEAKRVAELVAEHAASEPEKSLGVVAFSVAQEEAIREAIEARRPADDALDRFIEEDDILGEFFIKNLEMVQGDERDRMLFSVGYGPDEQGEVSMNFGPLNEQGGERRLNVAVTRARERVTVVSSLLPDDIDLSRTTSTGVTHFKRYLEYARDHTSVLTASESDDPSTAPEITDELTQSIYDALTARNLEVDVVSSSGYSLDLAIRDPQRDRYAVGLEIDASAYTWSNTARDRDRIRPSVLEDLGWDVHRIWAPDWVTNRDRVLKQIESYLDTRPDRDADATRAGDPSSAPGARAEEGDTIEVATYEPEEYSRQELDARRDDIEPFRSPDTEETRQVAFENASADTLREALYKVVLEYGPIHRDEAFRVIASRFGEPRRTQTVDETLDTYLRSLVHNDRLYLVDGFLWPQRHDLSFTVRQNRGDVSRSVDQIPMQEIALGVALILDAGFSMTREDLVIETARLFGYDRVGNRIRDRVTEAITLLEHQGFVETDGELRLTGAASEVRTALLDGIYTD